MENKERSTRAWYHVDAKGKILGRMSTDIATHLQGKYKPTFVHHKDEGDVVVVTNCAHVVVSGNKERAKTYAHFTGYPGGIRKVSVSEVRETHPTRIVENAVYHMLPKNKLRSRMMKRLKLFAESEHPYEQHLTKHA